MKGMVRGAKDIGKHAGFLYDLTADVDIKQRKEDEMGEGDKGRREKEIRKEGEEGEK